jgi:hypothetical protein
MIRLPNRDGRHLVMPRYTEPETDLALLLHKLKLTLPNQPPSPPSWRFRCRSDSPQNVVQT